MSQSKSKHSNNRSDKNNTNKFINQQIIQQEDSTQQKSGNNTDLCVKHAYKIQQLLNKIENLNLTQTDLKVQNDQLVRMISQQSQDDHQNNERNAHWQKKYEELVEQNRIKNKEIEQLIAGNQAYYNKKVNVWKNENIFGDEYGSQNKYKFFTFQQMETNSYHNKGDGYRSNHNNERISQNQAEYVGRVRQQSQMRKQRSQSRLRRYSTSSVKLYNAELEGGLMIRILDQRNGVNKAKNRKQPLQQRRDNNHNY